MLIHAFGSFLTTQNKQIASCRYICSRWMEKMNREIRYVRWLAQSRLRSLWNHSNLVYLEKHWQWRQTVAIAGTMWTITMFFLETHLTTVLQYNLLCITNIINISGVKYHCDLCLNKMSPHHQNYETNSVAVKALFSSVMFVSIRFLNYRLPAAWFLIMM